MSKFLNRLLILFFSITFSLIFIECGLRLLGIRPPFFATKNSYVKFSENPILGYELDSEDESINSFGLHNKELDIEKKDVFRILVLGDSVTFGCCELDIIPFTQILEERLAAREDVAKKIEVINAGVPGYNTIQESEFYRSKLMKLHPDLIILQYTTNDWEPKNYEFFNLIDSVDEQNRMSVFKFYELYEKMKFLTAHSFLIQNFLYDYTLVKYKLSLGEGNAIGQILGEQYLNTDTENEQPFYEKTGVVAEGIHLLSEEAKKTNTPVIVVIFPIFRDVSNYEDEFDEQHGYVSLLGKSNNLQVEDLLPCYRADFETNKKEFKSTSDTSDVIHPNQYGHEVAASCLLNPVLKVINK